MYYPSWLHIIFTYSFAMTQGDVCLCAGYIWDEIKWKLGNWRAWEEKKGEKGARIGRWDRQKRTFPNEKTRNQTMPPVCRTLSPGNSIGDSCGCGCSCGDVGISLTYCSPITPESYLGTAALEVRFDSPVSSSSGTRLFDSEGSRAWAFWFCLRFRQIRNHIASPISARPATTPITTPAIATPLSLLPELSEGGSVEGSASQDPSATPTRSVSSVGLACHIENFLRSLLTWI